MTAKIPVLDYIEQFPVDKRDAIVAVKRMTGEEISTVLVAHSHAAHMIAIDRALRHLARLTALSPATYCGPADCVPDQYLLDEVYDGLDEFCERHYPEDIHPAVTPPATPRKRNAKKKKSA